VTEIAGRATLSVPTGLPVLHVRATAASGTTLLNATHNIALAEVSSSEHHGSKRGAASLIRSVFAHVQLVMKHDHSKEIGACCV
jgi:hypothetical protein